MNSTRQIVLDTETTGLDPVQGHRIIEIGCVELIGRRRTGNDYHQYLKPDREIDPGAIDVHGISNEFLEDKPFFEDVAVDFLTYIKGAELIIHNAPFDVGFIDTEFAKVGMKKIDGQCSLIDTLVMARQMHPGQRNSLDALCSRYAIDNSSRKLHGALLDAEILADVYLAMTGGQVSMLLNGMQEFSALSNEGIRRIDANRPPLPIISATEEEEIAHSQRLDFIEKESGRCIWREWETNQVNLK